MLNNELSRQSACRTLSLVEWEGQKVQSLFLAEQFRLGLVAQIVGANKYPDLSH